MPGALFIAAIPLFLITLNVTWAVNDLSLYRRGFDTYNVASVTGIERDGLITAARQIRRYFNSTTEPLDIRAVIFGEEQDLFSQREVVHMRDVKRLIWGVYGVGAAAAVYILGFAIVSFYLHRRLFVPSLSRYTLLGSGLTLTLVGAVGLVALVGFAALFNFFHQVSFSNDFWRLNPRTDHLVMMFPQEFWFDATMFVALATVAEAIVLGAIGGGYLAYQRRQVQRRREPALHHPSNPAEL